MIYHNSIYSEGMEFYVSSLHYTLARLVETMLKGRMTVVYWKQQRSFFLECDAGQNG